jgi:undecaprenyl diphosphate synthase
MNNLSQINPANIPNHIAFIMDGNRRWARTRGLPVLEGHRRGVDALKRVVEFCADLGVNHVTLFTFSTENRNRPEDEVAGVMLLIKTMLPRELATLNKNNICLRIIGDRNGIAPDLLEVFNKAETSTAKNDRLFLNLAFNYGARNDIVNATKAIAAQVQVGAIQIDDINERLFAENLCTKHSPDPDLLIRPGSECRLSNYLLWELSYAEMVFLDTYWPDVTNDVLRKAIITYQQRERRFGTNSPIAK